jgi:hypothetical protein
VQDYPFLALNVTFFKPRAIRWIFYFKCVRSSETDSFFLPLARRLEITALPLAEAMRALKPCLFFLFLFDG